MLYNTRTAEREAAEKVSEMLNSYSFSYDGFCKAMTNQHRTLQQSFTRLCLKWLETCASEEYRYDGRNEASHKVAKKLLENNDNTNLPLV